jgi:hypothetical protein
VDDCHFGYITKSFKKYTDLIGSLVTARVFVFQFCAVAQVAIIHKYI